MTQTSETKARIQYSSRDELDVAVIGYCRGRSRHDLHARMRSALNGCYGPFAMAAVQASQDEIQRQALRSIQQLTSQILEIKERFLPELKGLDAPIMPPRETLIGGDAHPRHLPSAKGSTASTPTAPIKTLPNSGPVDQPLREFLGDDAAIMAGLNPFINDLT
ncbi:hypothetical protein PGN35_029920 [Nodosilinea sp. PGN35]|uniref:hypothetical protein n=1 Tax=unclassified Nodosilinea TaxID=2628167 RepID=UPI000D12073F|nr:hypothetical protein [Nodosilinea sp. TSF1-S3]MDF0368409.1 hypothetical protein [Nodosilinea sp. TSF1-S3]PSN11813.1 hypothetical protein C7293_22780 [filamentous cyanobacterium CCT1]PSN78636.1 hypothetical protein C8B47_15845 [filamentous cyanobacterium CCP4]